MKLKLALHGKRYKYEVKHYLMLLLLPLIMCVVLFFSVKYVIADQMQRHAELLANHFYVQSYSMLREMQIVSASLTRDSDFIKSISSDSSGDVDSLALCDLIRESMHESAYIGHVYVISERSEHIYSDMGSFDYRSLPAILQSLGAEAEDLFGGADLPQSEWYILNRNSLAPYCVVPLTARDGEPAGTLIMTIRMTEFLRIFFSLGAEVCCMFNDSFYVSSTFRPIPDTGFDWRDEQAVSELVGTPMACFYFDEGGYTYLVGLDRGEYNKPLYIIIWCFCAYALIVLALEYVYLCKISRQRQRQLASLIDALPTEHRDFRSSRDIYADIHKSLLEFRDQAEDIRERAQSIRLHDILYGHCRSLSAEQLKAAGIPTSADAYYVAAFFIDDISNLSLAGKSPDTYDLARVIFRSALANLSEGKAGFASCADLNGIAVVFSSACAEGLRDNVIQISSEAVKLISESYHISVQATISSPVASPDKLPQAFKETQKLRSFARSINSDVPLVSQEDMLGEGGGVLLNGDFIRKEQILINTLLAGKYRVIPSMVSAILAEHVSALRQNYSLGQERMASLANMLAEGVLAANLPGMPAAEAADTLRGADSVLKLNEAAEQVYGRMAELMNSGVVGSGIVSQACTFIRDHIDDPNLNVSAVCESVDISVQRLTRMFQAQFDMAIAEYINSYRITLAKELLADKHLTIVQIAEKVGYNNTDTLTRNFRKLEGITPSTYRKLLS